MIDWFARKLGYVRQAARKQLRAGFDAAQWNNQNRRHWIQADALSGDAAVSPGVRATLRTRGRHEFANNAFLWAQVHTLANDFIGTGPALQLLTDNEAVNQAVERRFHEWAKAIRLASKLRLMRRTRSVSGECFALFVRNPKVPDPVKLDLRLIEPDQVATPDLIGSTEKQVDGIEFDDDGNPTFYHILRRHPGDVNIFSVDPLSYARVAAVNVIHYFREERPGQRRGYTELAPALNLNADRRGYRQSVLAAARRLAEMGAIVLKTPYPADNSTDETIEAFSTLETDYGMFVTAPEGTEPMQLRPEQPSENYVDFDKRLISEQGRATLQPRSVALGDSSDYNFASVRADHQSYDRYGDIEQDDLEDIAMRRILSRWAVEATSVPNHLPARAGQVYLPTARDPEFPIRCRWFWRERPHVDPNKEAEAQKTRLASRTTTLTEEYARDRRDWRIEVEKGGIEHAAMDDADLVRLDGQTAANVAKALATVQQVGVEATVEYLTLLGVSRSKARRMAEAAERDGKPSPTPAARPGDVPPAVAARMNGHTLPTTLPTTLPANGNGGGAHA